MPAHRLLALALLAACAPAPGPDDDCVISRCIDGVTRSCDGSQTMVCPTGTGCADFAAPAGGTFGACACTDSAFAACTGERTSIVCSPEGRVATRTCEPGSRCTDGAGALPSCLCDELADGICPTSCSGDPDCASCTPDCAGRTCGDNGCGGSCGSCDIGTECDRSGACVAPDPCAGAASCGACTALASCGFCAASGRCTSGDASGPSAGSCSEGWAWTSDACGSCTPSCAGRSCGDDGCGGSCGSCDSGEVCDGAGECTSSADPCASAATCESCTERAGCGFCGVSETCRSGDATGPDTGTCGDWAWLSSECGGSCVPSCSGRVCGSDGCGGSCGSCTGDETCTAAGRCEPAGEDCSFERAEIGLRNDGHDAEWADINFCEARITQTDASGEMRTMTVTLFPGDGQRSVTFANSCDVNATVELHCSMSGGVECTTTVEMTDPDGVYLRFVYAEYTDGTETECFVL